MRNLSVTEWSDASCQIYITRTEIFTHNIIYSNSIKIVLAIKILGHCIQSL